MNFLNIEMKKNFSKMLNCSCLPNHIAFIMDGNRRFSKKQNISLTNGYKLGSQKLIEMIYVCYSFSIKEITFYTFSLDNFGRNLNEQNNIFDNLKEQLYKNIIDKIFHIRQMGIYIKFVGELNLLSNEMQELGFKLEKLTKPTDFKNLKLTVNINIAYSGLKEIFDATNFCLKTHLNKKEINLKNIDDYFLINQKKPVDLIIRTSNEFRKSDFLLWQSNYSNFYTIDKFWPKINWFDVFKIIFHYQQSC